MSYRRSPLGFSCGHWLLQLCALLDSYRTLHLEDLTTLITKTIRRRNT
uniref:5'K protein n=1 Tax=Beet black scorch virus TaxID=196375 RepID=G8HU30_9TOMB|nr:5'K protein [Beet black scorch virus]